MKETFDAQLRALIDKIPDDKSQNKLAVLADISSPNALLDMVKNTQLDRDIRVTLCWLLGNLKVKGAKPVLIALLDDIDDTVQHQAVIALGQLRSKHAIRPLLSLVATSTDVITRKLAVYALGEIGNGRVLDFLLSILTNPNENPEVRGQIAEAIGVLDAEKASLPVLLNLLNDDSAEVRFWAIYALGELGDNDVIPSLEALVNDSSMVENWWTVGQEASETIQHIKMRQEMLDRS
jgi:HEAT repeat protein